MEYGIFGLLLLIANIYALYNVWTSAAGTGGKIVWTLVIFFLPLVGFIAWLIIGPRGGGVRA
ncbi:MAG: PLDc N-terminal domain-containing protein [Shimia sp.]